MAASGRGRSNERCPRQRAIWPARRAWFHHRCPSPLRRVALPFRRNGIAMGGGTSKEKPKDKEKRDQARILKAITNAIETNAARLDLNNRHIRELPETFEGQKTALKWLSLSHNELKTLSDGVCQFVNLSALRLNGNQLSELPSALSTLTGLQVLDLSKNRFTRWDSTILTLSQLTDLNLQCNLIGLVRLPPLSALLFPLFLPPAHPLHPLSQAITFPLPCFIYMPTIDSTSLS